MASYIWKAGESADWNVTTDWVPQGAPGVGGVPPGSDIVSFAATGTGNGAYVVTIGSTDAYTVAAINLTGSKNHQQPSLSIAGSLTTGTLAYLTPTGGLTSAITVKAGGILDITSSISDTNSIAETITVAGTGAGGHVKLGGLAVSDTHVRLSFANNATTINAGEMEFTSGYTAGAITSDPIVNAAWGDRFVFDGANFTGDMATLSGTTLTVKSGATTVLTMNNMSAKAGSTFSVSGSQIQVVCYAAGTRILTATGERPVENLRQGDLVVTVAGDETIVRPVKWIGQRRLDLTAHPRPETVAPIRILRGAFADNVPHRDLRVSPDHAILVDNKLVSARQLINGLTILQEDDCRSVQYFHVELDAHAIVLAEGLTAESYLNTGNGGFFVNPDAPLGLPPDLTDVTDYPTREAASVAPFVWDEETVRPIWERLADRASDLGRSSPAVAITADPAFQLLVKGRRIAPLHAENGAFVFAVPRRTTAVQLLSRVSRPTDCKPWLEDRRTLGLYMERIVLREANSTSLEIPLDHPELKQGWWALERNNGTMRRWTNGQATLPLPESDNVTMLEIRASASGLSYMLDLEESRRAA